ncbi:hypothetical protein WDW37_19130 [Bdellovibrionota bacterium FG-1]
MSHFSEWKMLLMLLMKRALIGVIILASLAGCNHADESTVREQVKVTTDVAEFLQSSDKAAIRRILGQKGGFRALKISRLTKNKRLEGFAQYQLLATPDFQEHYAGLSTSTKLMKQVGYQLFRDEVIRRKKSASRRIIVTGMDEPGAKYSIRGQAGHYHRYAFRTSYFGSLKNNATQALADIETALVRVGTSSAKETIELLRLAGGLAKISGNLAQGRAILIGAALPKTSRANERRSFRVRLMALNFYNEMETDASLRRQNNADFIAAVGQRALSAKQMGAAIKAAREQMRANQGKIRSIPLRGKLVLRSLSSGAKPFLVPVNE